MNKTMRRAVQRSVSALAAGTLAIASFPGAAQETDEETEDRSGAYVEEVVVTVERREQNLQDLGVTAYSFQGDDLKMQGVQDVTDLSELAPGTRDRQQGRQRGGLDPRSRILQQR